VQESEIGQAGEHQWVEGVLVEHWIEGGKRWRGLSTMSKSHGRALVGRRAREEEGRANVGA
jgi:hypothetical protein